MKKYIFSVLLASLIALPAYAGFSLGQTRVIYNESDRQSTVRLINSGKDDYYLVQSWINQTENEDSPRANNFIITPPVFKFLPESENTLLIKALNENFPSDRESLFFLNVKAIPATDSSVKNKITFATKSVIKLIYRPKSLNAQDAANAWKKLEITAQPGKVTLRNPTPYVINLGVLMVNGRSEKISYAPPFGEYTVTLKDNARVTSVEYNVISDFGGASELHKVKL
ncbi:molecular chaperone [Pseudocitrobacter corydidari]|uniref:Chaperone protein FocC n=1 Tax=Pseudocitrobacter corydidari TaxID=2891570 RepID=A0ABY3S3K6_9ENTR|nr:molecular chaperone [Pseudocitrobacter corydidari]UGS41330.1 Chaperone protein FocC [Pseudocitrobacter corydidari]